MLKIGALRTDSDGQMPFAIVAVVLLLVTSYSVVVLADVEDSGKGLQESQKLIASLEYAAQETADRIRALSVSVMLSMAKEGGELDQASLQKTFENKMGEAISNSYPRTIGGIERDINGTDFSLRVVFLSDSPGDPGGQSFPSFAVVMGDVDVRVSSSSATLNITITIEAEIPVPLPLINGLLSDHTDMMKGSRSELGRLMSYQLGSLAQMRAMQGVGAIGDMGHLLTYDDVMAAVESSLDILERTNLRSHSGDTPLPANGSELDPAKLLLMEMGFFNIDLNKVLAQALYSMMDKVALQWMEYLDFIRVPIELMDRVKGDIDLALDLLLEKAGMDTLTVRYLKERMIASGFKESDYRYLNGGVFSMPLPAMELSPSHLGGRSVTVDPGFLIMDTVRKDVLCDEIWRYFLPLYRQKTSETFRMLQEVLADTASILAEGRGLPTLSIRFDPYDSNSFSQSLKSGVEDAMPAIEKAIDGSFQGAMQSRTMADPMSLELFKFIENYRAVLFGEHEFEARLRATALSTYVSELLAEPSVSERYSGNPSAMEMLRLEVTNAMVDNGATNSIRNQSKTQGDGNMEVFRIGLLNEDRSSSFTAQVISSMVRGMVQNVPGLAQSISGSISDVVSSVADSNAAVSGNGIRQLPAAGLMLQDGAGNVYIDELVVDRAWRGDVRASVLQPSEVRGGAIHYIGLEEWMPASYLSTIIVRLQGVLDYSLTSGTTNPLLPSSTALSTVGLDMELRIPVMSSWPMQGTSYASSNTLGGDLTLTIMRNIIPLMSHLQGSLAACDALFSFVAGMNARINGFVSDVMHTIANAILHPVLALQAALEEGLAHFIGTRLSPILEDAGRLTWSTDIFGLRLELVTNPLEFLLGMTKDLLRATLSVNVSDVHLSVSLRLLRMAAGDYYVLGTANMAMSDWFVSLTLDPSMRVHRHLVEVKGDIGDKGFHINFPQIMQYETYGLRLSQVPALAPFLSSIPLPIPGMRGSVDAGLELKYDIPMATDVVINEVELNPPGPDSGYEWVELFNPLNRDVDISGWTLTTGKGLGRHHSLPDITIPPGGYHIHTFPTRTLNNGDSMTIPRGDSVQLWNSQGRMVDSTPWMIDTDDDSRTWQREHDGSDRWSMSAHTKGESNGPRSHGADLGQWFVSELRAAATIAITKVSKAEADMDVFAEVLYETLEVLLDRILKKMASCIVEMKLFIYLGMSDLSGSMSAGLELSLVAGREFVLEGLRWILASVRQAVSDAINPGNLYPASLDFLLTEAHLRLSFITSMGPPDFIGRLSEDDSYEMRAMVEMNLAALGDLVGKAHEDRRIGFGVMISGVPGVLLPPMFKVDPGRDVDVWIMKGTLTY